MWTEPVWRFLFEVRCASINISGVLAGVGDCVVFLVDNNFIIFSVVNGSNLIVSLKLLFYPTDNNL